jgi:large subunit ribosomal protein L23
MFKVSTEANKIQIREAVQKIFSVKVLHVNTQVMRGKSRRFGKTVGQLKSWKKAMVQLKEGDKIEIFDGV